MLFAAIIILIDAGMPQGAGDNAAWLNADRGGIATATVLMPFAGMSFLWFMGVVRDGFGRYEDRFFATVFLGSGLLFLAMMFLMTAVAAALVASNVGVADPAAHAEVINFGKMLALSAGKTYGLRMASVFMISLATIWLRTGLMPRWLAGCSYLAAVALLALTEVSMWVTLAFPAWVLLVSGLVLARSRRIEELRAGEIE